MKTIIMSESPHQSLPNSVRRKNGEDLLSFLFCPIILDYFVYLNLSSLAFWLKLKAKIEIFDCQGLSLTIFDV